ncbi:hypothetical protein NLG97_g1813 [Lecanicillium saksenae]|uniref:Uncharacterized protein n=1 Tax=Lecanicillium saksenae TaxID=468837 RepID=A0ACC1R2Q4_9HYPO|nr:hypothetical protein NLG97_g1813 [Lecanicillium saksenae]
MHLILTGATGLVGSSVLEAMIKAKDVTKISVLSRRPIPFVEDAKSPKVNVIIHRDFQKYDANLLSQLSGAQGCVWALGISQTKVGRENPLVALGARRRPWSDHQVPFVSET